MLGNTLGTSKNGFSWLRMEFHMARMFPKQNFLEAWLFSIEIAKALI
jgi:hypothetical protein